jgi:hypothetical protein
MSIYQLFRPAAVSGAILMLQQTSRFSYLPFQWGPVARTWVRSQVPMDRFLTLHEGDAR